MGAPVELRPPFTHRQSVPHPRHSQRRRTSRRRSSCLECSILHSHVLCPLQRDEHIRRYRRISLPTGNLHPTTVQKHALGSLRQELQTHPYTSPALPPISRPPRSQHDPVHLRLLSSSDPHSSHLQPIADWLDTGALPPNPRNLSRPYGAGALTHLAPPQLSAPSSSQPP